MIRLFYYDSTWLNVDNDTDANALLGRGAVEYHSDQIAGVEGNECNVSNDTMFQDDEGNWYFHMEETTEPVDIPALKEQKHQELRSERDKLRQIEFAVYNNANYQIRQEDQDNMNTFLTNAIGMIAGIMTRENFCIMDADNIPRTLTPEQITELGRAMKTKVEEIYAKYWYARDVLLVNAQTKEEIQSITILSD